MVHTDKNTLLPSPCICGLTCYLYLQNTLLSRLELRMKAIAFTEQGGVDVLKYQEVAEPTLGPDEILVKVKACAVNYLDIHARRDRPEIKQKLEATGAPHILGSDIAGEIAEISGTHPELTIGDRVLLAPCIPCGACSDCVNGYENLCDTQAITRISN